MTRRSTDGRTIKVGALARVEGEGGMVVRVRDGRVDGVQLRIYEPPRFFEALLRGRSFTEPPDITARICGICPVAYQMTACLAIEAACGVEVDGEVAALRRLLYCGEWIGSHALHIYFLHAPDFLGYPGAVEMAADHRGVVERGLGLRKAGNEIMTVVGGRAIHPVNVRVGGFYRVPSRAELRPLAERVARAREAALETVAWVAGFDVPDFEVDCDLVALHHPPSEAPRATDARRGAERMKVERYPILEGRVASTGGIDAAPHEFPDYFVEEQVAHSTALHARIRGGSSYLVGPLARYSLNSGRLSPLAREAAAAAGLGATCRNPFRSIVVRAVEVVEACDQALRIIEEYEEPPLPAVAVEARAATGHGCTEAPRGLLYHRYCLRQDGLIEEAQIVPPTSQNQAEMERDLRHFVDARLGLPTEELALACERVIRSYDPCISCATHFLDLRVETV